MPPSDVGGGDTSADTTPVETGRPADTGRDSSGGPTTRDTSADTAAGTVADTAPGTGADTAPGTVADTGPDTALDTGPAASSWIDPGPLAPEPLTTTCPG